MESLKVVIVDDEIHAQNLLESLINAYGGELTVVSKSSNLLDAVEYIKNNEVDLLLLDVEMPVNNGTKINDFLTKDERPDIIFVTAYDTFAIEAIRLGAFDYIVKPVDRELFNNVLDRYFQERVQINKEDRLSIVTHQGTSLIKFDDILFLNASGSYSEVVKVDKRVVASKPLKYFEDLLPSNFIRIHRSYIVNKDKISGMSKKDSNWWVTFDGSPLELPVSRKYRSEIDLF